MSDEGNCVLGKESCESRVGGRDSYDFVWHVGRNIQPNLAHLEARMRQSGHWKGAAVTPQVLVDLLRGRSGGLKPPWLANAAFSRAGRWKTPTAIHGCQEAATPVATQFP